MMRDYVERELTDPSHYKDSYQKPDQSTISLYIPEQTQLLCMKPNPEGEKKNNNVSLHPIQVANS